jgi:hypothetical protein
MGELFMIIAKAQPNGVRYRHAHAPSLTFIFFILFCLKSFCTCIHLPLLLLY